MKKRHIGMLLMVLCMVGVSSATTIEWVTDDIATDQGWIDLLTGQGYTVNAVAQKYRNSLDDNGQAYVAELNAVDLVIISRENGSGEYDGDQTPLWNGLTSPILCLNSYLARQDSGKWKWLPGGTIGRVERMEVKAPSDSFFLGVPLDENNQVNILSAENADVVGTTNGGNGTVLATFPSDQTVWIAEWETGMEYYVGSGTYAGGPRVFFGAGHDAVPGLNINAAGQQLFLNIVYELSGATFNRIPFVSAGNDRIANAGETLALDGYAFDPEDAATISWAQLSGPAAATIEDNTIEDPNVTFPLKGVYVLEVTVDDGTTIVTDQMTAVVRDTADNAMLAHWDFETLPDPNTLVDVSGNGFTGVYYNANGLDPNVAAGNLFGGSLAADMTTNSGYWEIPNSYDSTDPNFSDLATGMTAAVWVKISDNSINAPMIIGTGLDGWRLQVNVGSYNFTMGGGEGALDLFGPPAYDDKWHHLVGVYDGVASQAYIYLDGLLAASAAVPQGTLFSKGTDYPIVQIANRGDADRPWKGYIDDIRVFNYPLSAAEIEALASEGNRAVSVTAGDDQTVVFKGTPIQLEGQLLVDDGIPAPAALEWTVVTAPLGTDPAAVTFSDTAVAAPQVIFPNVEGTYILRLTADDGELIDFDDVNITIDIPTCADVIADGYGLTADLSGPEGTPDCRVDMYDFAAMAVDWLRCNDPDDPGCEWAYQQ